mmetsp:Transcript_71409/g.197194  ORF Transcript_71409/g.197194 Transcript_71409/m.197194 type:complete len:286 (+) Transcript_71409:1275-2132(+)
MPGGSNEAWFTHEMGVTTSAPSLFLVAITLIEQRILPKASAAEFAKLGLISRMRRRLVSLSKLCNFCDMRTPASLQSSSCCSVGRNRTRIGSHTSGKPPSLSRKSISSTASPLHPYDPKTPQGTFSVSSELAELNTTPKASLTCVGISPPKVGLPRKKPLHSPKAFNTSLAVTCSKSSMLTLTLADLRPSAIAFASVLVCPYALAYITRTSVSRRSSNRSFCSVHASYLAMSFQHCSRTTGPWSGASCCTSGPCKASASMNSLRMAVCAFCVKKKQSKRWYQSEE